MVVGTYQVRDESVLDRAIVAALDSGYRSFDTAAVYENESFLASVLYREIVKVRICRLFAVFNLLNE